MTFGAPLWLAAAGGAAAIAVGLHLLAHRTARAYLLPTARFLPDRPAHATAPTTRPTDVVLLLLRVMIVLLLGAAFARPRMAPPRQTRTIVALDRSRAAAPGLDAVAAEFVRSADVVLAFDTGSARVEAPADSSTVSRSRGSLSVALVGAMRAAAQLAASGDSIELIIVSPFVREEWDNATQDLRRSWPGRIRLVPAAATVPTGLEGGGLRAPLGDPIAATVALLGGLLPATRLVRSSPTSADSAWAALGGTLVYWPAGDPVWPVLPNRSAGVISGDQAVVAAFTSRFVLPPGEVIARWADAVPAATERPLGAGCERDVGIPIPPAGDIALRPSVQHLVAHLTEPCGGARDFQSLSAARLDSLQGTGGLLASAWLRSGEHRRVPPNLWLLLAAGLLFLLEPVVRRDRDTA